MRFSLVLLAGLFLTSIAAPASRTAVPNSMLGRWQVSFALDGLPGTSLQGPSLGAGYRFTIARGAVFTDGVAGGKLRATAFYYRYANGKTLTVGLHVGGVVGKADLVGSVKQVAFLVRVQSSDLPGCTVGAPYTADGVLTLVDAGSKDVVTLTLCGRTRRYALGQKQPGTPRVSSLVVSIRPY